MAERITVLDTKYWKVILHPNQAYLGYSIVALKSEGKSMSDISKKEWTDLQKVIKTLESAFKKTYKATLFNWTCLLNDYYKKKRPKPLLHFHFRPRYKKKVKIKNNVFEDPEFAHHYNKKRENFVSKEIQLLIVERLKKNLK